MDINNLGEGQLIVALRDMAKEWSNNRGLANDGFEGFRYNELQTALKEKYGISAYIDTVDHHDNMQVIVKRKKAVIDIENISSEEAIHLMKVTINSNIQLEEIDTDLVTQLLREYRAINGAYDKLLSNVRSGKENLLDGIVATK